MTLFDIFLSGALAGVVVGAPIGPSGTLCLVRSVRFGWRIGLVSALGSLLAILGFSFLAALFFESLVPYVKDPKIVRAIQLGSGFFLIAIGLIFVYLNFKSRTKSPAEEEERSYRESFLSSLAIGLVSGKNLIGFTAFLMATRPLSEKVDVGIHNAMGFGAGSLLTSSLLFFLMIFLTVKWGPVVFARIVPVMKHLVALMFVGCGLFLVIRFYI